MFLVIDYSGNRKLTRREISFRLNLKKIKKETKLF